MDGVVSEQNNRREIDEIVGNKETESANAKKEEQAGEKERMYFNYGNETTRPHTILINSARVNAEPLVLPRWIDSRGSEMKKAEEKAAQGVDISKDEDLAMIHEQLEKSNLESRVVKCLATIFREYGDQVAIANREIKEGKTAESTGLDEWKLGNVVDFDDPNNLVFVVAEGRKDKIKALLENPPQASVGDLRMKFRMTTPLLDTTYLSKEGGEKKDIGFTVRLTYSDVSGKEEEVKKLFFLFAKSESEVKQNKN